MKHYLVVILILITLCSCERDKQNILIYGTITDATTNEPLRQQELIVENWAYGDSPDQSYAIHNEYIVRTDYKGYYEKSLAISHFVVVRLSNKKFGRRAGIIYVKKGRNEVDMHLYPYKKN